MNTDFGTTAGLDRLICRNGGTELRVVDTIISREGGNSAWANVVFVGDRGESVSVRLPCPVPAGGEIGRARIASRALKVLEGIASHESAESLLERPREPGTGRFGERTEAVSARHRPSQNDERS